MASDSFWWCNRCLTRVDCEHVTFHEYHDGCGGSCEVLDEEPDVFAAARAWQAFRDWCGSDALRALEAKVREAESEHAGVVATLGKALRDLSFAAQTTGGTAGRDEGLVAAIDGATQALSLIGVSRSIDLVSELRADRDRLAGEVEMYRRERHLMEVERDTLRDVRDRTCAEVARLTSELAAARENEARYLWLREGGFNLPDLPYTRQSGEESVAEIEAAIDAERLAPEEEDDD